MHVLIFSEAASGDQLKQTHQPTGHGGGGRAESEAAASAAAPARSSGSGGSTVVFEIRRNARDSSKTSARWAPQIAQIER